MFANIDSLCLTVLQRAGLWEIRSSNGGYQVTRAKEIAKSPMWLRKQKIHKHRQCFEIIVWSKHRHNSQQTLYIDPMLGWCWADANNNTALGKCTVFSGKSMIIFCEAL